MVVRLVKNSRIEKNGEKIITKLLKIQLAIDFRKLKVKIAKNLATLIVTTTYF